MVCVARGLESCHSLLPLEQPDQSRTHSEESSQSLQTHFVQVRWLLQLAHQVSTLDLYLRSVTGEILRTHRICTIAISCLLVDRGLSRCRNRSSCHAERFPDEFSMSGICLPGDAFSGPLYEPATRMLCTQSWYPEGPRSPRLVTTQNSCSFKKNHSTLTMLPRGTKSSPCTHTRSCFSRCL